MPNTTVRGLATRIYLQHREAIDLIIKHREAYIEDLTGFCKEAIGQQSGWEEVSTQANLVGFFPNDWKSFDSFHTGKGWDRGYDAALRFHFDLRDTGRVCLILTIPQGDNCSRWRSGSPMCSTSKTPDLVENTPKAGSVSTSPNPSFPRRTS